MEDVMTKDFYKLPFDRFVFVLFVIVLGFISTGAQAASVNSVQLTWQSLFSFLTLVTTATDLAGL